jgi:simple sugar transport system ATP-binding protein
VPGTGTVVRGASVVFVTHDPLRAHPVGGRSLLRGRGCGPGDPGKGEVSVEESTQVMAGGAGPEQLATGHERPRDEKSAPSPQAHPSG